jgi:hypothetical protein
LSIRDLLDEMEPEYAENLEEKTPRAIKAVCVIITGNLSSPRAEKPAMQEAQTAADVPSNWSSTDSAVAKKPRLANPVLAKKTTVLAQVDMPLAPVFTPHYFEAEKRRKHHDIKDNWRRRHSGG